MCPAAVSYTHLDVYKRQVLDGELMVFVIYQGEGEDAPVQWLEESIPFTGELDLSEASEAVSYTHLDVYKRQRQGRCRPHDIRGSL